MSHGGDRILEIRRQLGISQVEMARALKVTRETVGRWERGETSPDYDPVAAAEKLLTPAESKPARKRAPTRRKRA